MAWPFSSSMPDPYESDPILGPALRIGRESRGRDEERFGLGSLLPSNIVSYLSRAGARAQGLPVSPETSVGELAMSALGLPPEEGGKVETWKGAARKVGAEVTGIALDPLMYTGLGGLAKYPALSKGVAAGFTGLAGLGAVSGLKRMADIYKEKGLTQQTAPELAAEAAGAGIQGAFAYGGARHLGSLMKETGVPTTTAETVAAKVEAKTPKAPKPQAEPTLKGEAAQLRLPLEAPPLAEPPAEDLLRGHPTYYATERATTAPIKIPHAPGLIPEQAAIESRANQWVEEDPARAIETYKERFGNQIVSADDAKELFPDYSTSPTHRSLNSGAVHEASSTVAKLVFADRLSQPVPEGQVPEALFMAGGSGSGKTSALRSFPELQELKDKANVVFDSSMANFKSSKARIEDALAADRGVQITWVYRDPMEAWADARGGVVARSQNPETGNGRIVPVIDHISGHTKVRDTIFKLYDEYKDDPRVKFYFIDNSRGPGRAALVDKESIPDVQWSRQELEKGVLDALEAARAEGRIPEATYQGALAGWRAGVEPRADQGIQGVRGQGGAGVGLEPQPERAPGAAGAGAGGPGPVVPPGPAPTITIKEIQAAFPRVQFRAAQGGYVARLQGHDVFVHPTGEIEYNPQEFIAARGHPKPPTERLVGTYRNVGPESVIWLVKDAPPGTVHHEAFHAAMDLALSPRERKVVLDHFKTEEAAAEAYGGWEPGEKSPRNVFQRIYDFFSNLYRQFRPSWESTFGKVRGGKVWGAGETIPTEAAGPAFATAPALAPLPTPAPPSPFGTPPPVTQVTGVPTPSGQPPRVEQRVEALRKAEAEAGQPPALLAREISRSWANIDPKVQQVLRGIVGDPRAEKAFLGKVGKAHLTDSETMAMDAVVRGKQEAKDSALADWMASKGTPSAQTAAQHYADSLLDFVAWQSGQVNDLTGKARALAAAGRVMTAAQTQGTNFLRQVFKEIKGVSDKDAAELQRMFDVGDPHLADAIRAHLSGFWHKVGHLFRSNLVSAIGSNLANVGGNTITRGIEYADKAAAAGLVEPFLRLLRSAPKTRFLSEVGAQMGAELEAAPLAMREFLHGISGIARRIKTGESRPIVPGRPFEQQIGPFGGRKGALIDAPLELLGLEDDAGGMIASAGELAALSARRAEVEFGGKGPRAAVDARAQQIMAEALHKPSKYADMWRDVEKARRRGTFRDEPWKLVQDLNLVVARHPWLVLVMPFRNTPANIARYTIRHSPFNIDALKAAASFKRGEISSGEAADRIAPAVVGTLIMGTALAAAKMGKLTGSGPTDPKQRNALRETGWQPYSVVVELGDQKYYIPFSRFEPVSSLLGMAADVQEMGDISKVNDLIDKGVGSIAQNLTNKTYLAGLADAASAWSRPTQFLGQYASHMVGAAIPNIVAKAAQAIDPVIRDIRPQEQGLIGTGERILNTIKSRLPGVSETLPARKTVLGTEVERPGSAFTRFALPVQVSTEKPGSDLAALMVRVDAVPSEPSRSITINNRKVRLGRDDYAVVQEANSAAAARLQALISSPRFQALPDTIEEGGRNSKQAYIRRAYEDARDLAREKLLRNPAFRQRAREQLMGKEASP